MKRVAVCTAINADEDVACAAGELLLVSSTGEAVAVGASGPFTPPTTVDILVGLKDGSSKEVITINPFKFKYSVLAYAAAVAKTVVVGSTSVASKVVVADPTVASNMNKLGSITLSRADLNTSLLPMWGDVFQEDVQIVSGDTTASVLVKLGVKAQKIVDAINAKYGVGTVSTFTNGISNANAALTFVFHKDKPFNVVVDGIFDGTLVTVTGGSPFVSGLTGVEVRAEEREAAVLDGYNPNQRDDQQAFNIDNYINGVAATNYDCILIETTMPKQYETPGSSTGWDVVAAIYSPNVTPGTKGVNTEAIEAILAELKANHGALDKATADALYAAHA